MKIRRSTTSYIYYSVDELEKKIQKLPVVKPPLNFPV